MQFLGSLHGFLPFSVQVSACVLPPQKELCRTQPYQQHCPFPSGMSCSLSTSQDLRLLRLGVFFLWSVSPLAPLQHLARWLARSKSNGDLLTGHLNSFSVERQALFVSRHNLKIPSVLSSIWKGSSSPGGADLSWP